MKSKVLWLIVAVAVIPGYALYLSLASRRRSEIDPHAARRSRKRSIDEFWAAGAQATAGCCDFKVRISFALEPTMRSLKFGTHGVPEFDTQAQSRYRRCMALEYFDWEVGDVFVLHLQGPITLGQATQTLRQLLQDTVAAGKTKILLNMAEVYYIDSSGLGELVAGCTSAQRQGAKVKLMKLAPRVQDVMQLTKLYQVIDVFPDEDSAVRSFASS